MYLITLDSQGNVLNVSLEQSCYGDATWGFVISDVQKNTQKLD